MTRIPFRNGDEYDALTRWRHFLHWRAGERASIKRRYRRRERNQSKQQLLREGELEWKQLPSE